MPTGLSPAFFCGEFAPDPGLLLGAVVEIVAVQPQHLQDDVLAHRVGQIRVDEAGDRHAGGQMGVA